MTPLLQYNVKLIMCESTEYVKLPPLGQLYRLRGHVELDDRWASTTVLEYMWIGGEPDEIIGPDFFVNNINRHNKPRRFSPPERAFEPLCISIFFNEDEFVLEYIINTTEDRWDKHYPISDHIKHVNRALCRYERNLPYVKHKEIW